MRVLKAGGLLVAFAIACGGFTACQGNIGSSYPTVPQQGGYPSFGPGNQPGSAGGVPASAQRSTDLVLSAQHPHDAVTSSDGFGFEVDLVAPTPAPSASASPAGGTPGSHASPTATPAPTPSPSPTPTPEPSPSAAATAASKASPTPPPARLSVTLTTHPAHAPGAPGTAALAARVALATVDLSPAQDLRLFGLAAFRFTIPQSEATKGRGFSIALVEPKRLWHRERTDAFDTGLLAIGTTVVSTKIAPIDLSHRQKYQVVLYADPPPATPPPSPPAIGPGAGVPIAPPGTATLPPFGATPPPFGPSPVGPLPYGPPTPLPTAS